MIEKAGYEAKSDHASDFYRFRTVSDKNLRRGKAGYEARRQAHKTRFFKYFYTLVSYNLCMMVIKRQDKHNSYSLHFQPSCTMHLLPCKLAAGY